jgi:hypothetical protein
MDANERYQAIVNLLPPEQQADAMARQAEFMPLMGQFAPSVGAGTMDNAAGSWRGDKEIGSTKGRLERALASAQGSENELMAGISGPKYVPSAWRNIAVRQSPLMNVIKAVKAYKGGRDVKDTEGKLSGLYDTERERLRKQLQDQQGQYDQANQQGMQSAAQRIAAALARQGTLVPPAPTPFNPDGTDPAGRW